MYARLLPEGVRSQFLGPLREWIVSSSDAEFDSINDPFWEIVELLLKEQPGGYDDLPDWMTETATELLELNDPA